MKRIDAHIHHLPDSYREDLARYADLNYPLPPWSRQMTIDFMERYRIDAAVMSPSPQGVYFGDQAKAGEIARRSNEETAELVRSDPDRFGGLAVLPLPSVDAALEELVYAFDELALDGVILLSNVDGVYLGDRGLDPLFEELDRRGAYVFLHPNALTVPNPIPGFPVWLFEFPFDTTRAVVNLIYGGALERFPRVKIQLAHLGGTAPFLAHRIASLSARDPDRAALAPRGALEYLKLFYYDTGLSNNEVAFASTLAAVGSERVVFGSDWPYLELPPAGDPAPGLSFLDPAVRSKIDGDTIAALLPRLAS
jgi:6-methylsalicylate decarboxylase